MTTVVKQVPRSSYLLAATVFSASLLGLCMAVALPFFLAPQEYARFSLNWAVVMFVSSMAFEWVRISVIRHAGTQEEAKLRDNLRALYGAMVLLVLALAAVIGLLSIWVAGLRMAALICATAAVQGAFEGRSAWARANFDNLRLSIAAFARPAISLALVIGLAMVTHSATWALAGLCISYPLSIVFFRDPLSAIVAPWKLDRATSLSLLRFGVTAAVGGNITMAVPAALRSIIVGVHGLLGAGGVLLALDISQRVFSTMAMALNLLHFQTLVHVVDNRSAEEASHKVRALVAGQAALFVGVAVALISAAAGVGALLAPARYEADFVTHLPVMTMLMAILCLRQYAIDALFIAFRKVGFIAVGPIVTLALFGFAFAAARMDLTAREDLYAMLLAAAAAGFFVPFVFIRRFVRRATAFDAFAASGFAAAIAIELANGVKAANPILDLALQAILGVGIYGVALVALILLRRLWRRWRSPRAPVASAEGSSLDVFTGQ